MQPPRSRTPRIDLGNTETLRSLILNTTAIATTLLLLRLATLLVSDVSSRTIPGLIQLLTEPVVWPFQLIPILGRTVAGEVTVIEILIVPAVAMTGLMITGILTGWRESGNGSRRYPALRD